MKTRNVSLTAEIDAFVAVQIAPDQSNNAREVVRAVRRLLEGQERLPERAFAR